eukprot:scaffold2062_cov333-Pavlova_lutheri.AAC.1
MPSTPWFQELRPFILKGRVIPLADKTYGYEAVAQASSATTCPMVALQINRHASAEPTTLSRYRKVALQSLGQPSRVYNCLRPSTLHCKNN